jgi:diguanylate cyclase (GGDEF)-like protein
MLKQSEAIVTTHPLTFPINLLTAEALPQGQHWGSLLTGLLLGTILLIMCCTTYLWFRYRQRHYLVFICYILCLTLLTMTHSIYGDQFFRTGNHWLSARLPSLLTSLAAASGTGFCLVFLARYQLTPMMTRLLTGLVACNCLLVLATGILPPGTVTGNALIIAAATTGLSAILATAVAMRYRYQLALFCAGWSTIAIGMLVYALLQNEVLPQNALYTNSLLIGNTAGLFLLTLALCEQLYFESLQQLQQGIEATRSSEACRAELQASRAQLLEKNMNVERLLHKADRFDSVTGLLNSTAFHLELDREYKTALRHSNTLSVLALEISDLQRINEHRGHPAGDALLFGLAQVVTESLHRPGDITGRITGNRLGIVLPYTGIEGALAVAQRIKHRIHEWKRNSDPLSDPIKLRAGIASTENRLARHADDLIESAMAHIREVVD